MPAINIQNLDDQNLQFDLAYAAIDDESNDQLNILLSLDCGNTWRLISSENSKRLETTSNKSTSFIPNENQWLEKTIDLSRYAKYDMLVKFEFFSKNGNNIYIDNIRIGTTETGFESLNSNDLNIEIFPNPVSISNQIFIKSNIDLKNAQIEIMNLSGQKLFVSKQSGNAFEINNLNLNPGVYIFKIETLNGSLSKKLIVQ